MISFTFIALVSFVLGFAFYMYKTRLPPGVRHLPGPWGTFSCDSIHQSVDTNQISLAGLPYIGRVHDVPADATWLKV